MRIGTLNERIRIETRSADQEDGYGTTEGPWTEVVTAYAEVQEVLPGNSESDTGGVNITMGPARVRMRYDPSVRSPMRIVRLDREDLVMEIVTEPAEMGRKEGLEFMAQRYSTQ